MQLVLIKKKNVCFILDLNKQSSSEQIHSKVDWYSKYLNPLLYIWIFLNLKINQNFCTV